MSDLQHQAPGIEAALLACLMTRPELIRQIELPHETFAVPFHGKVYLTLCGLDADGLAADLVGCRQRLSEAGMDHREAGLRLAELYEDFLFSGSKHAAVYACQLRKLAYLRERQRIDLRQADSAEDPDEYEQARQDEIRRLREKFHDPQAQAGISAAIDDLVKFYQSYDERQISLGWPGVDAVVGHLHPGSVLTVLARTGVGKSFFASQVITNQLWVGTTSLFFASLEMDRTLAVNRMARQYECLSLAEMRHRLRSGGRPADFERVARERLALFTRSGASLAAIAGSIDSWERQNDRKVGIVVIDYLQYLRGTARESPYERASRLARECKELAKDKDLLVVLLSQVRRGEDGKAQHKAPSLDQARDSGAIEENADVVLGLWRNAQDDDVLHLKTLKVREGGRTGSTVNLRFDWPTGRLREE